MRAYSFLRPPSCIQENSGKGKEKTAIGPQYFDKFTPMIIDEKNIIL